MSCRIILALLAISQVAPAMKAGAGPPFPSRLRGVTKKTTIQEATFRISATTPSGLAPAVSPRAHLTAATARDAATAKLQELTEDPSHLVEHRTEEAPDTSLGQKSVASCTASSEYDSCWSCTKAIDGDMNTDWGTNGEGMCSWITLQFGKPVTINMMKYANRVAKERNKAVQLQFSDGSVETVQLRDDYDLHSFTFPEKVTRSVKIQVKSTYSTLNNGAREIEFWYFKYVNGQDCADAVVISGVDAHQTSRMGVYSRTGTLPGPEQAGRPIYQIADKTNYLYYWSPQGAWRIGADYANARAGVMSKTGENTHCPTQPSSWFIHADSQWSPAAVEVTPRA